MGWFALPVAVITAISIAMDTKHLMSSRFRGFLPVVVDVETGGFNADTDALLEIAAVLLKYDEEGRIKRYETLFEHVQPFDGANMEESALEFTGIDPYHPFRFAVPEKEALQKIFRGIRTAMREQGCKRAILLGHNATFDLSFVKAASKRTRLNNSPFHPFSTFDTVSLGGLIYGQTVLARAVQAAGLAWDEKYTHSAAYDAERTAELFCTIVNRLNQKGFPDFPEQ